MGGLQAVTQGLAVIKVAILARILLPSQFGVYGIALLVLGLLEVLTETGINVFLIQEKTGTEEYLDSAWAVSIARGILISLVIVAITPLIIIFFSSPGVRPLLYIAAGVAFVRGFINPMVVNFQKTLQFRKEFSYQSFLYIVDFAVAVIAGYLTKSESALVFSMLAAAVVEVISSFIIFPKRPSLAWDLEKVKKVFHAGKWITGAGSFGYLFQNIDDIVVGKFLGTYSLGLYQQAYRISTLPVSEVSNVFNKVTFPVFVTISGDAKRLKKAFFKIFWVISGLSLPFALLIIFFSHPLILIFLGDKWLPAEPVLKVLAVFGVTKAILNSFYSLFLSLKMQKEIMLSELFGIIGISIFIVPLAVKYGLPGVGYSAIMGALFSFPVIFFSARKIFKKNV